LQLRHYIPGALVQMTIEPNIPYQHEIALTQQGAEPPKVQTV